LINAQAGGKVTFNDTNDDSESEENSTNDFTVASDDLNNDNENNVTSTNQFDLKNRNIVIFITNFFSKLRY